MKILHIVPTYWPAFGRGGPTWSVHILNKLLVRYGFDVTVYTTDIGNNILPGREGKERNMDGVKVWYFRTSEKINRRGLFYSFMRDRAREWQYSEALENKLKETINNFKLVHITSTFLSVSTLGAEYAKKNNIPYIISPRGNLMKEPLEHNFWKKFIYLILKERKNLAGASAIHFTAGIEKREYPFFLPLKKSLLIPSHYDYEPSYEESFSYDFKDKFMEKRRDSKIILFLGRINWKKGFDTLIPAFAEIIKKEPKAALVIVGGDDEGYKKEVQSLINKFGLEEKKNVFFTGILIGFEKKKAFENSDVFVLPSYSENFGMAVMDSMAEGVPVIVTNKVGLAEDVKKAGAGLIIKKDQAQLVEAILKILKNKELGKKMGEAGKDYIRKEFSSEKIAKKWTSAYNSLIQK